MQWAIDKDGNKVHIKQTVVKEDYFCPICGEKMVLKKGDVREYHFAHPAKSKCTDNWHYEEMSVWHLNWQNRFPAETQEVVKELDRKKHRADVLIENKKIVFEFQHSPLTPEEFEDRNKFYNTLGYKVIWIFDVVEQFNKESIKEIRRDLYKWSRPRSTFNTFTIKDNPNVEIYLQIELDAEEIEGLDDIKKFIDEKYEYLTSEDLNYYYRHRSDEATAIKVVYISSNGFERFGTDGYNYVASDIVNHYLGPKVEEISEGSVRLGDLADKLIYLYSKSHTDYYFGCPMSTSHKCGTTNLDIINEGEIRPCLNCEYRTEDEDYNPMCKKRFMDLNLSGNTMVKIEERDDNGFISKLSYDGKIVELPVFEKPTANTVFQLWKENNYKIATFRNVRTGIYIRIKSDPTEQRFKYGKVSGFWSHDPYNFNGKFEELYGCGDPEWECVWFVKS